MILLTNAVVSRVKGTAFCTSFQPDKADLMFAYAAQRGQMVKKSRTPDKHGPNDAETSLKALLLERYGPLMGAAQLREALCYPSADAFRLALNRGKVGVKTFAIEGRRGRFALATDVADFLLQQQAPSPSPRDESNGPAPIKRA